MSTKEAKAPSAGTYTGREQYRMVTYLLREQFGVPPGFVVLGIQDVHDVPRRDEINPIIELKTWPEQFAAIVDGSKTFEWRRDDRAYRVGAWLHLREFIPEVRS